VPCCTKPCFGRLSEYGVAVYPQAASADQPVLSPPRAALPSASRRVCRRLGARYSQSLLSGRRAAGLPAKEPNQEGGFQPSSQQVTDVVNGSGVQRTAVRARSLTGVPVCAAQAWRAAARARALP